MQVGRLLRKNLNDDPAVNIGIDLMGSESSPELLFDAVFQAAKVFGPSYALTVFISEEAYARVLDHQKQFSSKWAKVVIHFTKEVIEMEDDPLLAIRHKKNSSLVTGIKMLKKKALSAFVSLGNTGALIGAASLNLPLLAGVKRPALLASIPTTTGHISLLDVGGSVSFKASQLLKFAVMGTCFEQVYYGTAFPRIGLLNVGSESKKGTLEHRLAYQKLKDLTHLAFIGNVEGFEVFDDKCDVVVTDGFTGNVLLKTAEGLSSHILHYLKKEGSSAHLKSLETIFSRDLHPGAILLGVEGVVVKCHGGSTGEALFNGIKAASVYVKEELINKMKVHLEASFKTIL